jgi:hypothetical protein
MMLPIWTLRWFIGTQRRLSIGGKLEMKWTLRIEAMIFRAWILGISAVLLFKRTGITI